MTFIKLIFITLLLSAVYSCGNNKPPAKQAHMDSVTTELQSAKALSKQIEDDPENAELYYQRAVLYFEEKYLDRSLSDIEDAIKLETEQPLYYFYKGRVLYAMNRTQDAAKAYESAIALKPDYTDASLKLAELYYIVKEHQKSINLLNTVIAAEPGNTDALFYKGMNQKEMKDTLRAIASFQKTLEQDGNYYDAAMQLGLLFTAKKDPAAIDYFSAAMRINPKSSEAYFARAFYYQQVKKFQQALFDYRKVISLDPSNDRAYYNVGYINFEAGKYKEALRSWDICIQMNNENMEAYYMRGLVHEYTKDYSNAKLNYEYALRLNPDYKLAEEGMERVSRK